LVVIKRQADTAAVLPAGELEEPERAGEAESWELEFRDLFSD